LNVREPDRGTDNPKGILVSTDIEMVEASVKSGKMQESRRLSKEAGWKRLPDENRNPDIGPHTV
jgi:hypothetical protein